MIWKYEWEALAAEISGFAEAVRDLTAGYGVNSGTSTTVIGDWLVPGMTELVDKLCEFGKTRIVNIPVNPKPPSRAAQGLNAAVVTQPHSNQGT